MLESIVNTDQHLLFITQMKNFHEYLNFQGMLIIISLTDAVTEDQMIERHLPVSPLLAFHVQ